MSTSKSNEIRIHYTKSQIEDAIRNEDASVHRAIRRLFEHQHLIHEIADEDQNETDSTVLETVRFFARYMGGYDKNNTKRWQPKLLTHKNTNRKAFDIYCKINQTPIERAREIALDHSVYFTMMANGQDVARS